MSILRRFDLSRAARWSSAFILAAVLFATAWGTIDQWQRNAARAAVIQQGGAVVVESRWPESLTRWLPAGWRDSVWDLRAVSLNDRSFDSSRLRSLTDLAGISRIKSLYLNGTGIDDSALVALYRLGDLESLYLEDTAVTDQGLSTIAELPALRSVSLRNTLVTPEGVERLEQQRPQLQVLGWMNMRRNSESR